MYCKMHGKSVWKGEADNFVATGSWVLNSKTLSCPPHRHQFLCSTQWPKAPSVHSLQSIAADRENHPSCLYIQLLWAKVTWPELKRPFQNLKLMWRSWFLNLWWLKLGELLSLGLSQALMPVVCQGLLASQQLINGSSSDCVSLGLSYCSQLLISQCVFILLLMPALPPFPPLWEWIFIHCGPLQFPL